MNTTTTLSTFFLCMMASISVYGQSYFRTDGDARIRNSAPTLNFTDTDDNFTKGQLQVNGDDFRITNGSGNIELFTGENNIIDQRMTIKGSTGYVGIGTSNPGSLLTLSAETTDEVGGTHQLYVREESSNFAKIKLGNTSFSDLDYFEIAANSLSSNEFQINFRDFGFSFETPFFNIFTIEGASQQVGINTTNPSHDLSVNGSAGKPGGGTWSTFSDRRLKQNIQPFKDGLNKVMQIKPVSYNFNGKAGIKSDKTHIGIIAQDIQKVAPYMVELLAFDDENEEAYLSYDGSALLYMLVNAVQEQQKIITQKIETISDLEARMDLLEESLMENEIKRSPSHPVLSLNE